MDRRVAAFSLWVLLAGGVAHATCQKDRPVESFEEVDPYTRGERKALDRAGYLSLGPFEWSEGVSTGELKEAVGAVDVLWVETAHFKIGTTLGSYPPDVDPIEDRKLDAELADLRKKLDRVRSTRGRIDPWLRLHLYALRAERIQAEFCAMFDLGAADFEEGTTLGMQRKPAVFLSNDTPGLERYLRRCGGKGGRAWERVLLPGGTMSLGMSAEGLLRLGYESDLGLHCALAGELTALLSAGLRESWWVAPMWLQAGLGHVAARSVDERFVPGSGGVGSDGQPGGWKWEPRVRGLVENEVVKPWTEMATWSAWEEFGTQGHLAAWSRTSWLVSTRTPSERKAYLLALTEPLPPGDEEAHRAMIRERQEPAARSALGKSLDELDAEWRAYVKKRYPKR